MCLVRKPPSIEDHRTFLKKAIDLDLRARLELENASDKTLDTQLRENLQSDTSGAMARHGNDCFRFRKGGDQGLVQLDKDCVSQPKEACYVLWRYNFLSVGCISTWWCGGRVISWAVVRDWMRLARFSFIAEGDATLRL